MKTAIFLLAILAVSYAAVMRDNFNGFEDFFARRGLERPDFNCDSVCHLAGFSNGGCFGTTSVCRGKCYCVGSDLEYRCWECDV